jgi:hypothetical protein
MNDPENNFSLDDWKGGPGVGLVLVLSMSALIIVGGLLAYWGPAIIAPNISRNPAWLLP